MINIHELSGCKCYTATLKGTEQTNYSTQKEVCDINSKHYQKERCEVETKCLEMSQEDCDKLRFELGKKLSNAELNQQIKQYTPYIISGVVLAGVVIYYVYKDFQNNVEVPIKSVQGLDKITETQNRKLKYSLRNGTF